MTIPLSDGRSLMTIDDADAEVLRGYTTVYLARGYAKALKRGLKNGAFVHRLIIGRPLPGFVIDHIDGNPLNNTRSNLRVVDQQTNQANRHRHNKNNTSGARGVYWHEVRKHLPKPWGAAIYVRGTNIHLGYYTTVGEAVQARAKAELTYFGEVCPTTREVAA